MAEFFEPTKEQKIEWGKWVSDRPDDVRRVAERFNPWTLYRMKSTGQRVSVYSYGEQEDGETTLTVNITGDYNRVAFNRQVFGINPNDLEECDLPDKAELVGEFMSEDEQVDYINSRRRENSLPPL